MSDAFQKAYFEIIKKRLSNTKFPDGSTVKFHKSWIFDDGKIDYAKGHSAIVCLSKNGKPIGLFKFYIDLHNQNRQINIEYIQGIKNSISDSKWYEPILEEFIRAVIPLKLADKKLIIKYDAINDLEHIQNDANNDLDWYNIEINKGRKLSDWTKDITLRRVQEVKAQSQFVNAIRDRYFTKTGELNLNRSRVQNIILELQKVATNKSNVVPKLKEPRRVFRSHLRV